MNIKNTTRVFWGLVIAAVFTLAACNQPNNTKTPTVNDDELGLKAKVLEALETNATAAGITFDKNSTTATVTNEVLLSNLFSGVELGDLDNVAITVKAAKEDAKTVEFDKDHGKFTVANAKDTTKGDTFVVTVVLAKDKKTTTVMFKVLNKKGVTAAPALVDRVLKADTKSNIHGKEVQLSGASGTEFATEIEVESSVASLDPAQIKFAFENEAALVAATEVKDAAGTGNAPALTTDAQVYTVKFAATAAYNEFTLKLKIKKGA